MEDLKMRLPHARGVAPLFGDMPEMRLRTLPK